MKAANLMESLYDLCCKSLKSLPGVVTPYIRRLIRFAALPYYYFFKISWEECRRSKLLVAYDLLYIFFKLKYYPDNYSLCRLWELDRSQWKLYYGSIYDPYQKQRLSRYVQRPEYSVLFEDKEVCFLLCKAGGFPLPRQYGCIDPTEDLATRLRGMFSCGGGERMIIKPVAGSGGHGILLASQDNGEIVITDKERRVPVGEYVIKNRCVVQEYLAQHESFNRLSNAFNTIRVTTLLAHDNSVVIVGAFIRFGLGNAYVDNLSSGGIAVGVNIEDGTLMERANDFNCKVYYTHPATGEPFNSIKIPFWDKVTALAKEVQLFFPFFRFMGLDIGVTTTGPVLIEINPLHDNVALEQSYGPILRHASVLQEFRYYDLLVNNSFTQR
jgi:hypothetical protein